MPDKLNNLAWRKKNAPKKKDDNHGCSHYVRIGPEDALAKLPKVLNIDMGFEEALKLSVAIQECVLSLNRFNRSYAVGCHMGLSLAIFIGPKAMTVIEKPVAV